MRAVALLLVLAAMAAAAVDRIEIRSRADVGPYERILGRVYYSIDPALAPNRIITDVSLAPRNKEGRVEFSGDLMVWRPRDARRSRGAAFLEVVNRGGPQSLYLISGAQGGDAAPERWDMGDRFLLEQGFTVVFLGWQFDVSPGEGLAFQAPTVSVQGIVRESYPAAESNYRRSVLGLSYCAADPQQLDARLTFRTRIDETPREIPRDQWRFGPNGCTVVLATGFQAGLYDAIYQAKDPPVAALGLAAIRDFASYLKYGGNGATLRENPASLRRIIGYGYSQSARLLRQFLHDGFNADEQGRAAFDALMISSAGAGGASVNHRFAMPGQAGNSVLSILRPVDLPPFTDDGLLAKAEAAHVTPRIFYTFSSTEYWARAGSLTTTTPDGRRDVALGPRSRLYFLTGTAHSSGPFPPVSGPRLQHYANFAEQRWVTRALLLDLDAWARSDTEPPPSQYPLVAKRQLVPLENVRFPKIPGLPFPGYMPQVWRMNYGAEFASRGVISIEPPTLGAPYAVQVPQVDTDGNDLGGVRLPEVAAPLGTYTGWNIQLPQMGQLHYLAGLVGSFEPFARSRQDRERAGDDRPSIAERYRNRREYLDQVERASRDLVRRRLMLSTDIPAVLQRAAQMWDYLNAR
ncbi:MAG TPA: alpha/beta hydrolase domain-containing protein [Bryobacteraceae bacterium]|nr:alpha/beta hydrolase domain-containing protein [Bryobacteraceae bacterium]